MSPLVPPLLVVSGLIACGIAVRAVSMVMADWHKRIDAARREVLGHVVWRPFDTFAVSLWCGVYAVAGVMLLAGVFLLAR